MATTDKPKELRKAYQATDEQIKLWKQQWKRVYEFTYTEGEQTFRCYLRNPTLQEIGLATKNASKNPTMFGKTIIHSCWLAGDEDIKEHDDAILSISREIDSLVNAGQTEVKSL
jgi:hypothetical protein